MRKRFKLVIYIATLIFTKYLNFNNNFKNFYN